MRTKTILIADDDCDLADALAVRCRQLGFNVVLAYDGLAASSCVAERPFDLVCLDVNMPFGNGMDVCQNLVTDDTLADTPVIVLTCRSDPETIHRCRLLGAHYLLKSRDLWKHMKPLLMELVQGSSTPVGVLAGHTDSSSTGHRFDSETPPTSKGSKS